MYRQAKYNLIKQGSRRWDNEIVHIIDYYRMFIYVKSNTTKLLQKRYGNYTNTTLFDIILNNLY